MPTHDVVHAFGGASQMRVTVRVAEPHVDVQSPNDQGVHAGVSAGESNESHKNKFKVMKEVC